MVSYHRYKAFAPRVFLCLFTIYLLANFWYSRNEFHPILSSCINNKPMNALTITENQEQEASQKSRNISIFAFILTYPPNHRTKAKAVEMTWARKLDDYVFSTTENDVNLKKKWVIGQHSKERDKNDRFWFWDRVKISFRRIYKEKPDYDWFLKADDDSYYVMENVREILSNYDPEEPWFMGDMGITSQHGPYPTGGCGYVLSRAGLKKFIETLDAPNSKCRQASADLEDVYIGECFRIANISLIPTVDKQGRHSMIQAHLSDALMEFGAKGKHYKWMKQYSVIPYKEGLACCSDKLLSLHYVSHQEMFVYDYLLYHVRIAQQNQN